MAIYENEGEFNLPLLGEEIEVGMPELFRATAEGRIALHRISYDDPVLTIVVPGTVDIGPGGKLDNIVTAHNPAGESKNQAKDRKRAALKTSARLKAATVWTADELTVLFEVLLEENQKQPS